MRRTNHHHRVKLETHRSRFDVSDSGEKQAADKLAVTESRFESLDRLLNDLFTRCFLDPPHQRFQLGTKLHDVRRDLQVIGMCGGKGLQCLPGHAAGNDTASQLFQKLSTSYGKHDRLSIRWE